MTQALLKRGTVLFLASAAALGPIPLMLSPICIAVIFGYSLFKRFSWSAHLFLGVALALAPGGAWVAVTGSLVGWPLPLMLMGAVATWVAGFDIIYSLQDESYDREVGLHSIPVRFGTQGALIISALLHTTTPSDARAATDSASSTMRRAVERCNRRDISSPDRWLPGICQLHTRRAGGATVLYVPAADSHVGCNHPRPFGHGGNLETAFPKFHPMHHCFSVLVRCKNGLGCIEKTVMSGGKLAVGSVDAPLHAVHG